MLGTESIRQLSTGDFIKLCYFAWGTCFFGFVGLWYFFRRLKLIEDTPRSLIRSAAQGYVELTGTAKLLHGEPIVAPLTGKRCVWWRYRIQSRSRSRSLDGSRRDTSTDIFMLDDGAGQCIIDPDKSDVTPSVSETWYGDTPEPEGGPELGKFRLFSTYTYTEQRIEEGADLCALGYFHTQDPVSGAMIDEEVRLQLAAWKKDQAWVLQHFDLNHDGQVDMQEWDAARQEARRLVLEKERENMKRPPVNVLNHPSDGRQFIISTLAPGRMLTRLRLLTLTCLLLFFVGGACGTWLIDTRFGTPPSVNSGVP